MKMLRSKSFRTGVAVGFASPYYAVFSPNRKYRVGERNLVGLSWANVGKSIRAALDKEAVKNDKVAIRAGSAD